MRNLILPRRKRSLKRSRPLLEGENNSKKLLTNEPERDLLGVFSRQIAEKAFELQYGNLVVKFKVRKGAVKDAHLLAEEIKLRPF